MLRQKLATLGLAVLAFTMLHPQQIVAADSGPSYLSNETLIVARIGDSNSFAAYSKHSGKWTIHKFADGLTAIAVMGQTHAAFQVAGDSVTELVAVNKNGEWRTHKLPKIGTRTCTPVVGSDVAAFSIDGMAYAFSGLNGSWASTAHPFQASIDAVFSGVIGQFSRDS